MRILAIDPGTTESGWVVFIDGRISDSGVSENSDVLWRLIRTIEADLLAVEMVASYGMPVGAEVFETVRWIGRFEQAWIEAHQNCPDYPVRMVYRKDVKMHLCGSVKAKDANIRQRLIDLLGPPGTKKAPGATYGVKSHAWPALAVAVTAAGIGA